MRIKIIELEADASELKASNDLAGGAISAMRYLMSALVPGPEPEKSLDDDEEVRHADD